MIIFCGLLYEQLYIILENLTKEEIEEELTEDYTF